MIDPVAVVGGRLAAAPFAGAISHAGVGFNSKAGTLSTIRRVNVMKLL
jgi:hypothetical protein